MTHFVDGPAHGVTLSLRRAPLYLRVVHDGAAWDALDQPMDEPRASETIYAYRREGEPTLMHVRETKISGWYQAARYTVCAEQPLDDAMRSTAAWQQWCGAQEVTT